MVVTTVVAHHYYAPETADIVAEWLSARAARDGLDPYLRLTDLAAEYGIPYDHPISIPRTPGALLLSQPISLLPIGWLPWMASLGVAAALVTAASLVHRLGPAFVPILLVGAPGWDIAVHGHVSMAILALCSALFVRGRTAVSGMAAGVATTLKLFPGLWVLALLVTKRRAAAGVAGCTFVVLNGLGLALPGVALADAVSAIVGGSDLTRVSANGSLIAVGVPVAVVVAAVAAFVWLWPRDTLLAASVPVSVVSGPIAWIAYVPAVLAVLTPAWSGALVVGSALLVILPLPWISFPVQLLAISALALIAIALNGNSRTEKQLD